MLAAGTAWKLFDFCGIFFFFFFSKITGVLPGNETVIFWGIFCNIQCKCYYNNLHKHAPSINRIFLVFFMKFNFLVFFFLAKKNK